MNEIKFTISGLRGIWQKDLNISVVREHVLAYATYLNSLSLPKRILLGRDGRNSGPIIIDQISKVLTEAGFDVVDVGIVPTPTVLFLVRTEGFSAGIIVTASHNPIEYNGLKFVSKEGVFIDSGVVFEMKKIISDGSFIKGENIGNYIFEDSLAVNHINHIIKNFDSEKIRSKKFKVALDPINASGCILGLRLLEELGCEVFVINGEPDGNFTHPPEPLPENLTMLGEKVLSSGAIVGFALDPDADRLVLADEKGKVIFEEYTIALCVKGVLQKEKGDVVVNMSTSRTVHDVAESFGSKTYTTPVGEANVVLGIKEHGAVIGGEGSGGVIYPKVNFCRDGLVGMVIILELLASTDESLSEIVEKLPHYVMQKEKIAFTGDLPSVYKKVQSVFTEANVNTEDGLRFDFLDRSWVQIRASNTEPIIRVFAEAQNQNVVSDLIQKVKECIT